MHIVAVHIAKYLEFDMMRAQHETLDQHIIIAKCAFGLAPRRFQLGNKVRRFFDKAHAFTAATRNGFDQ